MKGLKILGFPSNQFGLQEPGTPEEIQSFVKARNVKFELTEKVDVNGPNTCDTYRYLKVSIHVVETFVYVYVYFY